MLATRMRTSSGFVWDGYLYKEGDEYEGVTGGWVAGNLLNEARVTLSKESDHMYLYVAGTGGTSGYAYAIYVTDKKINLTAFNKISIEWRNTGENIGNNTSRLCVGTKDTSQFDPSGGTIEAAVDRDGTFTKRVTELDITGVSGEHHILVKAMDRGTITRAISELFCYNIWRE